MPDSGGKGLGNGKVPAGVTQHGGSMRSPGHMLLQEGGVLVDAEWGARQESELGTVQLWGSPGTAVVRAGCRTRVSCVQSCAIPQVLFILSYCCVSEEGTESHRVHYVTTRVRYIHSG